MSTKTDKTSVAGITAKEMLDSLTGYDEIAIEKAFGFDIWHNSYTHVHETRAFIFVHLTRAGKSAAEAKKAVLSMPYSEQKAYFEPKAIELDADKPETDQGKDDSQPE